MNKIEPFADITEAKKVLDNGGRFYNLLTKADDGNISAAEVGKVAGLFSDRQQMILYLTMAIAGLTDVQKKEILSALSDDLKSSFKKYYPQYFIPSEAKEKGELSTNTVISGIPKMIESKSDFNGFIMVPISTGKAMTFVMIPIIDRYDVYELHDDLTSDKFLIAHARGDKKLPLKKIKVGGIIKEIKVKKEGKELTEKYLEALYFSDIK